jgi:ABC-type lipoprotein release transport system permease subunit
MRAALGSTRRDLLRLVLTRSTWLIALGLSVGLLGAVVLAHSVWTLLYGVTPYDVVTLISVSVLLAAVARLASYLPAMRAAGLDPTAALRER